MAHHLAEGQETSPLGQNTSTFDFDEWTTKYNLDPIKHSLTDHDMTSLDTLDLNNSRFHKLMSDPNVLAQSHLIPNIVSAIQSLQSLRVQSKTKQIAFVTEKENRVFVKFQEYIEQLNVFEDEMKTMTSDFERKQITNRERIETYSKYNLEQLDNLEQRIESIFERVHDRLNQQLEKLRSNLNECREQLNVIQIRSEDEATNLTAKMQESSVILEEDRRYYIDCIGRCKSIISNHRDDDDDSKIDFKSVNEARESEVLKIGKMGDEHQRGGMEKLMGIKRKTQEFNDKVLDIAKAENKLVFIENIDEDQIKRICDQIPNMISVAVRDS